jgi:hypothetical protein
MPKKLTIAASGLGRKRPLRNLAIGRLHLDPENPRLPEDVQGRGEDELMQHLYDHFDLDELATSMAQNGYFDEEPLVAVPNGLPKKLQDKPGQPPSPEYLAFLENAQFTVVEGNRRLATARILREPLIQKKLRVRWPDISPEVRQDLDELPVIIYPTRKEVLPYLGVRHITGNKKWDSYAKARYIAAMLAEGHTVDDIEREVGDRSQGVLKNAISYSILQQAQTEIDYDISRAKDDFSYMLLAIGQRNIKIFLGWTKPAGKTGDVKALPLKEVSLEAPIPETHLQNLRSFLSWIYGEGSKVLPVIKESRDITTYLAYVVASEKAVEYLKRTRDLREAYDLTDGEEAMVRNLLGAANTKLEKVLGVIHRYKTLEVISEAEKCAGTAARVLKTVQE